MNKNWIVSFLVLWIVTGCKVTPSKQPLLEPIDNKQIAVFSIISQDELEAIYPVQNTGAAGATFGLAGALVSAAMDSAVNAVNKAEAEEQLIALREELKKFDFNKLFAEELKIKLKDNINIKSIKTLKSNRNLNNKVSKGDLYFVLNTSYLMQMDFRTPFISITAELKQRSNKGKGASTLYKNTFTYYGKTLPDINKTQKQIDETIAKVKAEWQALPKKDRNNNKEKAKYNKKLKKARKANYSFEEKREKIASAWTTKYSGEMETNLRNGIQDLFTIIANDIRDTEDPKVYENKNSQLKGYPENHKAILISEENNRRVIRFTQGWRNGAVCSMPYESGKNNTVCL